MNPIRRHLSYANVAATLALVFAMSGGALAASRYLVNSTKQINPKVLKKLRGKTGPRGATGTAGPAGATGAAGTPGPLLDTLPTGHTLHGTYSVYGIAGKETNYASAAASFPIALATAPAAHFLFKEQAATPECPGSAAAPTAAPGNLCVYEGGQVANGPVLIYRPDTQSELGASRVGFVVWTSAVFEKAGFGSWGTWAVTAP